MKHEKTKSFVNKVLSCVILATTPLPLPSKELVLPKMQVLLQCRWHPALRTSLLNPPPSTDSLSNSKLNSGSQLISSNFKLTKQKCYLFMSLLLSRHSDSLPPPILLSPQVHLFKYRMWDIQLLISTALEFTPDRPPQQTHSHSSKLTSKHTCLNVPFVLILYCEVSSGILKGST